MSDGYGYYYGGSGYSGYGYSGYTGGSGYYGGDGLSGSEGTTSGDLTESAPQGVASPNEYSKSPVANGPTAYLSYMSEAEARSLLDDSNPNATNGSRQEQGAWIYENGNGDVYFENMPPATKGPEGLYNHLDDSNPPAPADGYFLAGEMHTHPFDSTYYDSSAQIQVDGSSANAPPSQADVNHTPSNLIGIVVSGHNGTYYFLGKGH